ncbi:hypothetical protein TNCV_1065961 [Trichonephila clavipes]|nr:hypothetical protein TNCV_1065961 [Trichonephila clavipes]
MDLKLRLGINHSEKFLLRHTFGVVNENGLWGQRHNFELYKLFKVARHIESIKISRLRAPFAVWNPPFTFRIFNCKLIGKESGLGPN